mgnify:CR=1 FL=1
MNNNSDDKRKRSNIQRKIHGFRHSDGKTEELSNHREATFAESDMDFIHKLQIAQKECGETIYWLELLKATEYISEELFNSLYTDAEEIMRMLTSSIMTTRKRLKKLTIHH